MEMTAKRRQSREIMRRVGGVKERERERERRTKRRDDQRSGKSGYRKRRSETALSNDTLSGTDSHRQTDTHSSLGEVVVVMMTLPTHESPE